MSDAKSYLAPALAKGHPHWSPRHKLTEQESFRRLSRRRARITNVFLLAALMLSAVGALKFVQIALSPQPTVGVMSSGWIFGGRPEPLKVSQENLMTIFRQIVEGHFARTEAGGMPGIEDFSTPDTMEGVLTLINRGEALHMVELVIVDERMRVMTAEPLVYYRARMRVVDQKAAAFSEAFIACRFRRDQPTASNTTGWRLVGLRPLERSEFYWQERDEERRRAFGLEAESQ